MQRKEKVIILLKSTKKYFIAFGVAFLLISLIKIFSYSISDNLSDADYQDYFNASYKTFSVRIPKNLNFAGEKTPITDFSVREATERELVINTYWQSQTLLLHKRANRWFPIIEPILEKNGIPSDFKYIALIESQLTNVVSPQGATGFWQIIESTGTGYGMEITEEVDERYHVVKSTEAACKYLAQLYSMFHNWELALAAYNSGPGTVRKAIRRSGYKKSFWEVYPFLPRETRAYVPQYVAIIYAMNYAAEHNIVETAREELLTNDTLQVKKFLHFETFANLTGTCVEDLQKLNPSVQRNVIPETGKTYTIKIPLHAKLNLEMNRLSILDSASKVGRKEIETIAPKATGNIYGRESVSYTVKSGDVIGLIAERHHVRVDDIKGWNNLHGNTIYTGQRLKIWLLAPSANASSKIPKSTAEIVTSAQGKVYTVQPGDSLWDIAKKFEGLTIEKIKILNNLKTTKLQPGQKLIVG